MWIQYPIFALILLFLWLWLATASMRIKAVRRGELSLKAVNFVLKDEMNKRTRLLGNSYDNQYQQPILFICLLAFLHIDGFANLGWYSLAITFVVARYWHCFEHIRGVNIRHRTYAFALSSVSLFIGWGCWFAVMSMQ
ncbi:MAPEG family protein [Pseudoalteromonas sp. SMS1]|uniref:MAPEG family protein n=1 Tax=Pseudoalteromonas sp. SMS1 TaxID=2908894 RepID=UPI001F2D142C|nr:MAPEG family protein [Pseudoalteromonas sp. SMS1]MCF2859810.1 MAPEG family protein [Pseudoalteromonas sp. SMS1]